MIGNKVIDKDVTNFLDISNLFNGIYLCETILHNINYSSYFHSCI